MEYNGELFKSFVNLEEEKVYKNLKDKIAARKDIKEIIDELQTSLIKIGKLFEKGEYFITELVFAGEIMKNCNKILEPYTSKIAIKNKGAIIIGTVFGDIHDLGKNLVIMLLEGAGFKVVDLGVDVRPQKFTEAIIQNKNTRLIGLSALLTNSFSSIEDTVNEITKNKLREKVKIMIGGGAVTELVREKTGCDYYCKDAYEGVKTALKIYQQNI